MLYGDQRSDRKREYSDMLVEELRKQISHPAAFDSADLCTIFNVEYLMQAITTLNKANLVRGCPKVAEAESWLRSVKENFTSWQGYETDYSILIDTFTAFIATCEDNN